MRRAVLALLFGVGLHAQTPKFDVASLKAAPDGTRFAPPRGGPGTDDPEHFVWDAAPLTGLITRAYGLDGNDQVTGPDWISMQLYAIAVNIPAGATREQFQLMLQGLLAERLRIAVHHVTRTIDGYDLVIAKGGAKLKEPAPVDPAKPGFMGGGEFGPDGATLTFPRSPVGMFANTLAGRLRTDASSSPPVAGTIVRVNDKTGLTGIWNITLHYVPARMTDVPGPDIFAAVESQLGLKLQPVKMQVDAIVVDHAEKTPAEN